MLGCGRPRTRPTVPLAVATLLACSSATAPERPLNRDECLDMADFEPPAESPWCLPYAEGTGYLVTQSYCSAPGRSHFLRYAYDFQMPMATEILAARDGQVVELREQWPDSGTTGGEENVVILEHEDGTLSLYIHMMQNGITVELGDTVRQGDLLGYVGMSGTSFSHLHFQVCLRGGMCSWKTGEWTLPVSFRNVQGELDEAGGLAEGVTYTAGVCRQPGP